MAAADAEKEATARFLREHFRRHYASTKLVLPDRYARREFGFMFFQAGIVQRHLGFSKEDDLREFLVARTPAHAYYSSAYYETPDAPTMEEKGWLGADLIFDLDADHLPGAKAMTYAEMLEAVKAGIIKLWDRFLVPYFGFDESKMRLVFSGGRGYHIHVFDERVWALGTHERREIVDFLTAKGLDPTWVFRESPYDKKEFQGRVRVKKRVIAPSVDAPGWAGILARGVNEVTRRLESLGRDAAMEFVQNVGHVDATRAASLYDNLFAVRATKPRTIRGVDRVREGQIEALHDKDRDALIQVVLALEQIPLTDRDDIPVQDVRILDAMRGRGETDEPVTSDIKRLIRLPTSLHGRTGLAVLALTRDELDAFRPLRDAIPTSWSDERTRVRAVGKITLEMHDETFNVAPGVNEVPQFLAIFLAARGLATVSPEA